MNIRALSIAAVGVGVATLAYAARPATPVEPRYAIASSNGVAYRLDIHTGDIRYCDIDGCRPVFERADPLKKAR